MKPETTVAAGSAPGVDTANSVASPNAPRLRRTRCRGFMRRFPFSCSTARSGRIPSWIARLFQDLFWEGHCRKFSTRFGENSRVRVGVLPQGEEIRVRVGVLPQGEEILIGLSGEGSV